MTNSRTQHGIRGSKVRHYFELSFVLGKKTFLPYVGMQASTVMSSLRRLCGGMGSIAVEAVIYRFLSFGPPPIDSRFRTRPRWNDMRD